MTQVPQIFEQVRKITRPPPPPQLFLLVFTQLLINMLRRGCFGCVRGVCECLLLLMSAPRMLKKSFVASAAL